MNSDTLLKLRPKANTSAEIRKSIATATDTRQRTLALLCDLEARRGAVLVSGSEADVQINETAIVDARIQVEQLDAFLEAMQHPLHSAEKVERIAALEAQLAEIGADEKTQQFADDWQRVYPPAAAAIAALCHAERDAIQATRRAMQVIEKLKAEGVVKQAPAHAANAAAGGAITCGSLGSLIRLPGASGAPNIPIDHTPRHMTRLVEKLNQQGPCDGYGQPTTTRVVEMTVPDLTIRPVRDDAPFWWPDN